MARRHVPSTRALLVFDAVARHHGVSRAAEELFLSHSAVSQQLRQLEEYIGVALVQRGTRGTELTDAGRRYHAQIVSDLTRLENHTQELQAKRPGGQRLLVGAMPVFAERWLAPRLPRFLIRRPHVNLYVSVFPTRLYLGHHAFDLGVQYDDAVWPGAAREPFMDEVCHVVCAPDSRWQAAAARGDFRGIPLLQLGTRLHAWDLWFDQAGIAQRPELGGTGHRFDMFSVITEAVRADLGLGLLPQMQCAQALADGTLCLAHPFAGRSPIGYSLFTGPQATENVLRDEFAQWLRACAAEDAGSAPAAH